jgi:CTP-dependent riboflavin kinase
MKLNGIIFSDLGQASSFITLDWVMHALRQTLGFAPYPATLNLRPRAREDVESWQLVQHKARALSLSSAHDGFCNARLFLVEIVKVDGEGRQSSKGAVLVPDVPGYPKDKIEVVAPVRLKDALRVKDGDQLTLEFIT